MRRDHPLILLFLLCFTIQGCGEEKKAFSPSPPKLPSKPKHELYLEWHNRCLEGTTSEIDAQIKRFEASLRADNNDQLARVYLGSACALRAKASFWGPTKLKYLRRGQMLMDQAVEAAPDHPRVRMVRAIASYKVPKRFGRRKIAIADFEKLMPAVTQQASALQMNERQVILYYAWLTFKEEGHKDAHQVRSTCHRLAPDSKYGKLTRP